MLRITIYNTIDCGFCQLLKSYLQSNNIHYDEKLVDNNPLLVQEIFDNSGQLSVPFTLIQKEDDSEVKILGFDKPKLDEILGLNSVKPDTMRRRTNFTTIRIVASVLGRPKYALAAVLSGFIVLGLLVWLLQFPTLSYIFSQQFIPVSEKLSFFFSGYVSSFQSFFNNPIAATRIIFSVLAGINVALYISTRQHSQVVRARKGFGGFSAALFGSGCATCGTSLISPLLAGVGAGTAVGIGVAIGSIGNLLGIALILYSINSYGKRLSYDSTCQSQ
ncbi:MAG: glutaredoxin domain-containing protein [Candidatus Saccharimonadales bacterium]